MLHSGGSKTDAIRSLVTAAYKVRRYGWHLIFALLPLYLTEWRDAVYDGGLLIVSIAFLADALFRLVDPSSPKRKHEWNLYFILGTLLLLVAALLQYGPIANDLRHEKAALNASLATHSVEPLRLFELEREQNEKDLPNSSAGLLLAGIVAEFGVILYLES